MRTVVRMSVAHIGGVAFPFGLNHRKIKCTQKVASEPTKKRRFLFKNKSLLFWSEEALDIAARRDDQVSEWSPSKYLSASESALAHGTGTTRERYSLELSEVCRKLQ